MVASDLDFLREYGLFIFSDPKRRLNRIEQTVDRGIRFCSHADLPEENRNVLTYFHVATLKDDMKQLIHPYIGMQKKKSVER